MRYFQAVPERGIDTRKKKKKKIGLAKNWFLLNARNNKYLRVRNMILIVSARITSLRQLVHGMQSA